MIIFDYIQKGGLFMWPLALVALVAFFLICYKGFSVAGLYFRYRRLDVDNIRELLKKRDYQSVKEIIKVDGSVEKIMRKGVRYLEQDYSEEAIKDRLEMIYEEECHKLEEGLSIILVLAEIMPMLGLLGTVSGMIQVFKAISVYGAGNAEAMASGISEALLTTETGLVLAIPTMFCYTILNSYIERVMKCMRQVGATVVTSLRVVKKKENI
jgi:biopolymer transport protein ExbB